MKKEEFYRHIIEVLDIRRGAKIYLASDILRLTLEAKKRDVLFDANELIDAFQNAVTEEGTLMIPAFCYDFSKKGVYDYITSGCNTGAVSNTALKREDFVRTAHPMHSFMVWGADKDLLAEMNNRNSFGRDSPFGWMHDSNVTQIMLGTDYTASFTFCHYCEWSAEVPYRFLKEFTGKYTDADGVSAIRTYEYPCRIYEYGDTEQMNRIGEILEAKGVASKLDVYGIPARKVKLGDAYPLVYQDAKYNMCRNLYDFKTSREEIWREK